MTPEKFKTTPIGKALIELSTELKHKNMPPVTLNVVGGFALLMRGLRPADSLTDIDYVGTTLPADFNEIADRIGMKYKLGKHWINNDIMLSDISLEDFQSSTGKLHFEPMLKMDNIEINVLTEPDLMRLKLIAIDTNAVAAEESGEFKRHKDFPDMKLLMERNNVTIAGLSSQYREFITSDSTLPLITAYNTKGEPGVRKILQTLNERYNTRLKQERHCYPEERSPFVAKLIDDLFKKNAKNNGEDSYN